MATKREYLQSIIAQSAKILARVDNPLPVDFDNEEFTRSLSEMDATLGDWLDVLEGE